MENKILALFLGIKLEVILLFVGAWYLNGWLASNYPQLPYLPHVVWFLAAAAVVKTYVEFFRLLAKSWKK